MGTILMAALCFVGFSMSVARLRIVAKPHPTLSCRAKWWLWVAKHALWAIGFFAGAVLAIDGHETNIAEWGIRIGLVIYLWQRVSIRPMSGTNP